MFVGSEFLRYMFLVCCGSLHGMKYSHYSFLFWVLMLRFIETEMYGVSILDYVSLHNFVFLLFRQVFGGLPCLWLVV